MYRRSLWSARSVEIAWVRAFDVALTTKQSSNPLSARAVGEATAKAAANPTANKSLFITSPL
jgi:hypothetical protein